MTTSVPTPDEGSATREGQVSQEAILVHILDELKSVKEVATASAASAAEASRSAKDAMNSVLEFGQRVNNVELIARRAAEDATTAKRIASETGTKVESDLGAAATHMAKIGEAATAIHDASEKVANSVQPIQAQNDQQTVILTKISSRMRTLSLAVIASAPSIAAALWAVYSAWEALRHHAP